jgi:hypothetical protein
MKRQVKTSLRYLLMIAFACLCAASVARAEIKDARLVSARAGGVNFVAGDVTFRRAGETGWQRLTTSEVLKSGDAVKTGADGRVELLLNPGTYFRAGENTEFELVEAALDDLRLSLARGAAVVEATGYDDLDLSIVISTPQTRVSIVRSGIYLVTVGGSGLTEVAVRKGRAKVGEVAETLVKGGQVARVLAPGEVEVAKLNGKIYHVLELWSKERAKELAKLNEKLANRNTRTALSLLSLRTLFPDSHLVGQGGVWVFINGCYTFVPFFAGWGSPYGYGYGSWLYTSARACNSCPGSQYPVISRGGATYGGSSGSSYGGGNSSGGGYSGGGGDSGSGGTAPPPRDTRPEPLPARENPPPSAPNVGRSDSERVDRGPRERP